VGLAIKEACGVFGIFRHKDAARLTYLGLYALQHRGQESAGIVTWDGHYVHVERGMGLVADVFTEENMQHLKGDMACGHVRYSTTGASRAKNIQPFVVEYSKGWVALGHNGNLVNARSLRRKLEGEGAIFQTSMDSEIIVHLIARAKAKDFRSSLLEALGQIKGAYSIVMLTPEGLVGIRDPNGFRPLCLGQIDGSFVIASETCALDIIQAQYIRDIEPGEALFISDNGVESVKFAEPQRISMCIFEYIYFARPDSNIYGHNVHMVREKLGRHLAREASADADIVIPVPDSGTSAAIGFAKESGIPFEMAIVRNHYVGRTFIQPSQHIRDFSVKVKYNFVRDLLKGKRLVVVEDSIVRGTTSRTRMRNLREAGAREIHMRISCPPHRYPCFYGIDFPTRKELIAANKSVEEIKEFLGLDSLSYLSLEGMLSAMPLPPENFCVACFTGEYPVPPQEDMDKLSMEGIVL